MNRTSDWCIQPWDSFWKNKVILFGVGWWQYQGQSANWYTRILLKRVLSREYFHSVRDSYTEQKLKSMGFNTVNTGDPSLWLLRDNHTEGILRQKSGAVLLTFTEYNQHPSLDRLIFEVLKRCYTKIYFWPQMYGDYYYAKKICDEEVIFIAPSLEALDQFLSQSEVDYVGTRLHAGIRTLQHKKRTLIISVDNRASEMCRDFNIPYVKREECPPRLESMITCDMPIKVNLPYEAIEFWKSQFSRIG